VLHAEETLESKQRPGARLGLPQSSGLAAGKIKDAHELRGATGDRLETDAADCESRAPISATVSRRVNRAAEMMTMIAGRGEPGRRAARQDGECDAN
jgi:hypothetical protein